MDEIRRNPPDRPDPPTSDLPFVPVFPESPELTLDYRAFLQALDLLPHGLAFFDLAGMLLCANRTLTDAIQRTIEGDRLFTEVSHLALKLGVRIRRETPPHGEAGDAPPTVLAANEFHSVEGTYHLRGSRVDVDLFGLGTTVLITVEPPQVVPLPDEALRLRFGLTRTEIRVARRLAEGRSNKGIAAELGISPHTARHHTQRVLHKLGVSSRARVGRKLQG